MFFWVHRPDNYATELEELLFYEYNLPFQLLFAFKSWAATAPCNFCTKHLEVYILIITIAFLTVKVSVNWMPPISQALLSVRTRIISNFKSNNCDKGFYTFILWMRKCKLLWVKITQMHVPQQEIEPWAGEMAQWRKCWPYKYEA